MGRYAEGREPLYKAGSEEEAKEWVRRHRPRADRIRRSYLMVVQQGDVWAVLEGGESDQALPALHLINDAEGLGRDVNTRYTEEGDVVVDGDVCQFNLMLRDDENEDAELLADYGGQASGTSRRRRGR